MKKSIYNGIENMTKKDVIRERATEKRNVSAELGDFAHSIEYAYKQLTAVGSVARNAANAAKGTYKTALQVVSACYPYQDKEGNLYKVVKGEFVRLACKGRAQAGTVVRVSVQNFIDYKTGRRTELVTVVE